MLDAKAKPTRPLCFVVGPIGPAGSDIRKHSDMLLHAILKDVLEKDDMGYEVKRADKDPRPGMINDRVIHDIINAELVVADLTDLNPNAFYELGIRHLSEKPTIHIAREGTKLPFDNLGHDTIFVDVADWNSIEAARKRLYESAQSIKSSDYIVSNPITQAKATIKLKDSADPKDNIIAKMHDRLSVLEKSFSDTKRLAITPMLQAENPFEPNSSQYKISHDINLQIATLIKNQSNDIELYKEINKLASNQGWNADIIVSTDKEVVYDLGIYRITMKRDGTGWSTGPAML